MFNILVLENRSSLPDRLYVSHLLTKFIRLQTHFNIIINLSSCTIINISSILKPVCLKLKLKVLLSTCPRKPLSILIRNCMKLDLELRRLRHSEEKNLQHSKNWITHPDKTHWPEGKIKDTIELIKKPMNGRKKFQWLLIAKLTRLVAVLKQALKLASVSKSSEILWF